MNTSMKKFVKKLKPSVTTIKSYKSAKDESVEKKQDTNLYNDSTSLFSLKADQEITYDEPCNPNYYPPLKEIIGIQFTFLTSKEIEDMSVIRITQPKLSGENTVSDPRLGTITNYQKCPTCSGDWKHCPGHPAYIKLPTPIPHPIRLKQLADVLTNVCQFCHRLILSKKQMKVLQIFKYKGEHRFNAYLSIAKKTVRCYHCKKPHGKYTVIDDKFLKCYKKKSEIKKVPVFYEEVVDIIYNIREKDFKLLGFVNNYSHPSNMIISNLLVLPPCVIPFVESSGATCEDDLKYKYIEICKKAITLQESGEDKEKDRVDLMDSLMFHIKTLMDNSKNKARDPQGKRGLRSIKQRMTSKGGLIRQNIQAKRSDLTGRSVISPDPDMHVNEVGIPIEIAKKVPYPEEVNRFNLQRCQLLLEEGRVSRILRGGIGMDARFALYTRGFKFQNGDQVIRNGKILIVNDNFKINQGDDVIRKEIIENEEGLYEIKKKIIKNIEPPKRKQFQIKIGDIIERDRQDGDWTIFNRQPTLWGPSVRAKRIRIRPGKTFQFDLASTQCYNADFDGDEMNIFPATSHATSIEMQELMSTMAQFINESDSKPVLSFKQDNMLGGYVFTSGRVPVDKATFMDACCKTDWDTVYITKKIEHIRKVFKWKNMLEPEMEIIKNKIDKINQEIPLIKKKLLKLKLNYNKPGNKTPQNMESKYNYLKSTLNEYKYYLSEINGRTVEQLASDTLLYTGYGLFSILLPTNFEYKCDTKLQYKKCYVKDCNNEPYFNINGDPKGKYCEIHKQLGMVNVRELKITRGVIISGTINKVAIGSSSGSLIHHLYKDYGAYLACDFVTYYQRFTNILLGRHGFTVGMADCIPKNTDLMKSAQNKCFLEAKHVMETETDIDVKEAKILGLLNSSTNIGETIAQESLNSNNNFVPMIVSGAKGSMFNITHITSAIGQQNVEGKRIPKNCNGRSLPHFNREEDTNFTENDDQEMEINSLKKMFQSRGYITNSFYHGLSPQEYFFLSAGGREGLTDTSIKTAKCGYISRRILKLLEDVKISYNGTVVNSRGNVVQFCYGEDNYSAGELIKTEKFGYQATDVSHLVDTLNADFEWDNK